MQAAVLRIKLRHLDSYVAARQAAAKYYTDAFADVDGLETPANGRRTLHMFFTNIPSKQKELIEMHYKLF